MHLDIKHITKECRGKLNITGSKSETNRLLLLQRLISGFEIKNKSNSEDSRLMEAALSSKAKVIDINHAGTAMRFLASYYASKLNSKITLTGSDRMKNRPIGILVDALRDLGAEIEYKEKSNHQILKQMFILGRLFYRTVV